jgi:nucleotide-binding universal stress UspA family protein
MTAPVVVGVDDVDQSSHALDLAGREAELRGAPLWIAHSYHRIPPGLAAVAEAGGAVPAGAVLEAGVEPLAGALELVHADHPEVEARTHVLSGSPGSALPALARDASLLVLGHRGRGGFAGMLLGSVALRILARTRCPVAVARGARRGMNRVLVGIDVDDVAKSQAQLDFAFTEAVMRGAELVVLHVWEDRGYFYPDPMGDYTRDHLTSLDSDHHGRLEAMLEPWRRERPDVRVDVAVEGGSASRGLVDASGYADLLVVGGRPHSDGEGMRVGGLAYALLHHAQCPVVIVPEK